jgi:hypothetical protein
VCVRRKFIHANASSSSYSDCQACIWVDDPSSSDYHHCWQTSGLGGIIGTGQGQISYKGTCSGSCSSTYMNKSY